MELYETNFLFYQMKCNENYLSIGFIDVNNLPYCVLQENIFEKHYGPSIIFQSLKQNKLKF